MTNALGVTKMNTLPWHNNSCDMAAQVVALQHRMKVAAFTNDGWIGGPMGMPAVLQLQAASMSTSRAVLDAPALDTSEPVDLHWLCELVRENKTPLLILIALMLLYSIVLTAMHNGYGVEISGQFHDFSGSIKLIPPGK